MGRGVMTHGDNVVYFDASGVGNDYDWGDMQDNITYSLEKKYPSLCRVQKWQGCEIAVILENDHVQIGISEYCGCGAVSVFIREGRYGGNEYQDLAEHWLAQCWPKIRKIIKDNVWGDTLVRLGTMSNGVSVYEKEV